MTSINIAAIEELGALLGFSETMETPLANRYASCQTHKMERHDAPVLTYLYRNQAPRRHLEFGTWEGFGTVLCAKACDAQIWTVNLPDGEEKRADGALPYTRPAAADYLAPTGAKAIASSNGRTIWQTDAGPFIGRLYREAGLEERVTQILSDSKAWDCSTFKDGFFDSVLIDGGHAPDVVASDTHKAIRLLRAGGLCIWHDFNPDRDAIATMEATRGVVTAVLNNLDRWSDKFSSLFWVRHTFLLVGVRSDAATEHAT